MRFVSWIALIALLALLLLTWKAWRGADPMQPDLPAALAAEPLPALAREPGSVLSGFVVDGEGGPVPDALVSVVAGGRLHWTQGGLDGRFAFDDLPPGEHRAQVVAPGYAPIELLVRAPDERAELVLAERQGTPPLVDPPPASDLEGRVEGLAPTADGLPHRLAFLPLDEAEPVAHAVTRWQVLEPDGGFHVADLIHARYRVLLLPPRAGESLAPDLLSPLEGSPSVCLEHPRPEPEPLVLDCMAGAVQGKVLERDPSEPRGTRALTVGGARVVAIPVWEGAEGRELWSVSTDAEGQFALGDLPPGSYRVQASAGGRSSERIVTIAAHETVVLDLPPLE